MTTTSKLTLRVRTRACNVYRIGATGFESGSSRYIEYGGRHLHLQEGLTGYEQLVPLCGNIDIYDLPCIVDYRVRLARPSTHWNDYRQHTLGARRSYAGVIVETPSLFELPLGRELAVDLIPGGVAVRRDGSYAHGYARAGDSFSWSKHQLHILYQPGDYLLLVDRYRRIATAKLTKDRLVLRHTTPKEEIKLLEETEKLTKLYNESSMFPEI